MDKAANHQAHLRQHGDDKAYSSYDQACEGTQLLFDGKRWHVAVGNKDQSQAYAKGYNAQTELLENNLRPNAVMHD